MAQTISLILSIVFAGLSAASIPEPPRFRFLSAAVALLALALLIGTFPALR